MNYLQIIGIICIAIAGFLVLRDIWKAGDKILVIGIVLIALGLCLMYLR